MYLFIDTISPEATFILFEDKRIIGKIDFIIKGKEYDNFLINLNKFLNENNILIDDIKGIIVVNGPGGFTGTRIVALTINSINFTKKIPLCSINYFDLLQKSGMRLSVIIKANRGEYLLKDNTTSEPRLINIADIPAGDYSGIGDIIDFEKGDISIKGLKDYEFLITNNEFVFSNNRIEPYYIKKPSIS